jgi:hypothetical protein
MSPSFNGKSAHGRCVAFCEAPPAAFDFVHFLTELASCWAAQVIGCGRDTTVPVTVSEGMLRTADNFHAAADCQ